MELLEGGYISKKADAGAQKQFCGLRWAEVFGVESLVLTGIYGYLLNITLAPPTRIGSCRGVRLVC